MPHTIDQENKCLEQMFGTNVPTGVGTNVWNRCLGQMFQQVLEQMFGTNVWNKCSNRCWNKYSIEQMFNCAKILKNLADLYFLNAWRTPLSANSIPRNFQALATFLDSGYAIRIKLDRP